MDEFKIGDGVKCKYIDGPNMIVSGSMPAGFGNMTGWTTCMWFNQTTNMWAQWNFPPVMLEKLEK